MSQDFNDDQLPNPFKGLGDVPKPFQMPEEGSGEAGGSSTPSSPADQPLAPARAAGDLVPDCSCHPPDPRYDAGVLVCAKCGAKYKPRGTGRGGIAPPVEHQFQPGVSGNPAGRPRAGASIAEWMNQMQGYTKAQIERVLEDDDAPAAKLAAARTWKHAMSTDKNKVGTPIAGDDLDRICDRTVGAPTQPTITGRNVNVLLVHTAPPPKPESQE